MTDEIHSIYGRPIGTQQEFNGLLLTLTEDGWRAELKHSMMRRCKGWDYCQPWTYLVTIGCQHHDAAPRPEAIPVKCSDSQAPRPQTEEFLCSLSGTESSERLDPIPASWHHPDWLLEAYSHQGRPHLFGTLTGSTEEEAAIALNDFGKAVEQTIDSIPTTFPKVRIIEKVVMPNHIHMVIRVKERLPKEKPLGYILDRFKSWVNRRYKEICLGLPANTLMDLSYQQPAAASPQPAAPTQPGDVTCSQSGTERTEQAAERAKPAARASQGHGSKNPKIGLVFEAGFHDRILFREGQLQNMIDYCRDNPRRLWKVVNNSQYFHTVSGVKLTMPLLTESGTKGRSRWQGPLTGLLAPVTYSQAGVVPYSQAWTESTSRQTSPNRPESSQASAPTQTVTFNLLGNISLLKVPERMQIQCSRSMTEAEIETLKDEVLEACEHGVVPISPCISPGEKAVARAVMNEGYSLIALFPQGIPEDTTYKPYKEYFDACANGLLLIMSPWRFENGKNHLSRWQCLFLNDTAMQISTGLTTLCA